MKFIKSMFGKNIFAKKMFAYSISIYKRELSKMKDYIVKFVYLFAISIIFLAVPMHLGNHYLRASEFDTVTIQANECIWDIAGKYTVNTEDKAELVEAICEINDISPSDVVKPGQLIQVPVIDRAEGIRVASNN